MIIYKNIILDYIFYLIGLILFLVKSDIARYEFLTNESKVFEVKANELSSLIKDQNSYVKTDNVLDEVSDKLDEAAKVYARIFTNEAKINNLEPENSCGLLRSKNHEYILKYKT